jgi:hypothetical protein
MTPLCSGKLMHVEFGVIYRVEIGGTDFTLSEVTDPVVKH